MSDAVKIQLIVTLAPIITMIISHYLQSKKLNHITELSNSTLTHTIAKKEEAENKLSLAKIEEVTALKTKNAELENKIALLTKT